MKALLEHKNQLRLVDVVPEIAQLSPRTQWNHPRLADAAAEGYAGDVLLKDLDEAMALSLAGCLVTYAKDAGADEPIRMSLSCLAGLSEVALEDFKPRVRGCRIHLSELQRMNWPELERKSGLGHEQLIKYLQDLFAFAILVSARELTASCSVWVGGSASTPDASFVESLLDGFSARDRRLLLERLRVEWPRRTLMELGEEEGVTRERIRQIEAKCKSLLQRRLASSEFEPIASCAAWLRNALGPIASEARLQRLLPQWLAVNPMLAAIALWWAGGYRLRSGWVCCVKPEELRRALLARLRRDALDGAMPIARVREVLSEMRCDPQDALDWLCQGKAVRIVGHHALVYASSLEETSIALLSMKNKPQSLEWLMANAGRDYNRAGFSARLCAHPRIMRCGLRLYGLRRWRLEEYRSIRHAMSRELQMRGGAMSLVDMQIVLSDKFGVSRSSVSSYALNPPFRVEDGIVTRPRSNVAARSSRKELRDTKRCYRIPGGWAIRIEIGSNELKGIGPQIPASFARYVGGTEQTTIDLRASQSGMRLYWNGITPALSSIRETLIKRKLKEGDYLFLCATGRRVLGLRHLRNASVVGVRGAERAAVLCGVPLGQVDRNDVLLQIGIRLGIPRTDKIMHEIAETLLRRQEKDLLDLITEQA